MKVRPVISLRCVMCFLCLFVVSGFTGCGGSSGPKRSAVRGKVTFDGAPVSRGMIVFLPEQGVDGPSSGGEITNGEYTIPEASGPVAGMHRVEITASREEGNETTAGVGGATAGPSGGFTGPSVTMYIPTEYNRDSKLKEDIKTGDNEFNFELKKAP